MREEKFHIYLNDDEYGRVIQSLIRLKNSLIAQKDKTFGIGDNGEIKNISFGLYAAEDIVSASGTVIPAWADWRLHLSLLN